MWDVIDVQARWKFHRIKQAKLKQRLIWILESSPPEVKQSPLDRFKWVVALKNLEFLYHVFVNMDLFILQLTRPGTLIP